MSTSEYLIISIISRSSIASQKLQEFLEKKKLLNNFLRTLFRLKEISVAFKVKPLHVNL